MCISGVRGISSQAYCVFICMPCGRGGHNLSVCMAVQSTRSRCDCGLVQISAVDFGFHGVRTGICMQPHTCFFLMHTHRGLCACRTSVCARAARIRGHAYVHLSFLLSHLCVHSCCDIVFVLCHHQLLDTVCVQNQWIQGACLVCLDVCFRVHNRGRILISQ